MRTNIIHKITLPKLEKGQKVCSAVCTVQWTVYMWKMNVVGNDAAFYVHVEMYFMYMYYFWISSRESDQLQWA